ncbi:MAG: rubredoxin-like domain-containing protein [Thermodesulfobacteriota bacterium]
MKKWRCTVCGYIHEGDEPPDECPVCGADKSMFEEVTEEEDRAEAAETRKGPEGETEKKAEPESKPAETAASKGPRKWRCTVCGYIHEGDEPPDECPVCGADKSMFEEVTEEEPQVFEAADIQIQAEDKKASEKKPGEEALPDDKAAEKKKPKPKPDPRAYDLGPVPGTIQGRAMYILHQQMLKHHGHPMVVHIPNGVLPMVFIFMILTALFQVPGFCTAAFWSLAFVVITLPAVIYSGYIEWQKRYRGYPSDRIIKKIIAASVVAVSSLAALIWWIFDPDVLSSSLRWAFITLNLVTLAAAIVAGYIGGKYVFRD